MSVRASSVMLPTFRVCPATDTVSSTRAAVPTHFAKVLIASRAPRHPSLALVSSKQAGTVFADGKEWVQGAFVLPNESIPDETKLESFVVPGELGRTSHSFRFCLDCLPSSSYPTLNLTALPVCAAPCARARSRVHLEKSRPWRGQRACLSCPTLSRRPMSSTSARSVSLSLHILSSAGRLVPETRPRGT